MTRHFPFIQYLYADRVSIVCCCLTVNRYLQLLSSSRSLLGSQLDQFGPVHLTPHDNFLDCTPLHLTLAYLGIDRAIVYNPFAILNTLNSIDNDLDLLWLEACVAFEEEAGLTSPWNSLTVWKFMVHNAEDGWHHCCASFVKGSFKPTLPALELIETVLD